METFRVRLNCIDHYQANPSDIDPPVPLGDGPQPQKFKPKIPVIRIFGATENGQKVCAHVHGALPYLYIEYRGGLEPEEVDTAIRGLQLSIDHALAVSYRRNAYDASSVFVAHISLVKGVPFYGYHVGYRTFFKIYLLNPLHVTRLADLLRQGAVMKRTLQPYESHLQFIPQWMCDYNLYGCDYLRCKKVTFRSPVPAYSQIENPDHDLHDESIPTERISDPAIYHRQSHCALEVDIHVRDILNRQDVRERPLHHSFVGNPQVTSDEKLVPSLAGLWEDEKRRRRAKLKLADPASSPFSPADLISMSADPRSTSQGGWVHEEEFKKHIENIVKTEESKCGQEKPSIDNVVPPMPREATFRSALESVEDLFPENLRAEHSERQRIGESFHERSADVDVDESLIRSPLPEEDSSDTEEDMGDPFSQSFHELEVQEQNVTEQDSETGGSEAPGIGTGQDNIGPARLPGVTEFGTGGIRKSTELADSEADLFDIGDEFISEVKSKSTKPVGATRAESPCKRMKVMDETTTDSTTSPHANRRPDILYPPRFIAHNRPPSGSQDNNVPEPAQQAKPFPGAAHGIEGVNRRISFQVVKDSNDPATALRLSQNSQISKASSHTPPKSTQPFAKSEKTESPVALNSKSAPTLNSEVQSVCLNSHEYFNIQRTGKEYKLRRQCPTTAEIRSTIGSNHRPSVVYQKPFYSNEEDVPDRPREYAGREFKLESDTVPFLPPFDPTGHSPALDGMKSPILPDRLKQNRQNDIFRKSCSLRAWEFYPTLPSRAEVIDWACNLESKSENGDMAKKQESLGLSQIDGPTQKDKHGFKYSQKKSSSTVQQVTNYMSVMSLEVHVNTRGTLAPNPEEDEISSVFWCVQTSDDNLGQTNHDQDFHVGIITLSGEASVSPQLAPGPDTEFEEENTEIDLLTRLVDIVRYYDPDILTGYEVHNGSWGYLIERARHKFDYDLCDEFSRVKTQSHGRFGKDSDRWGFNHTSTIRVTGRHMINIWRAMRGELNLLQYTMENVVFHLLQRRIPHFPFSDLTRWFKSDKPRDVAKVMNYFASRAKLDLQILEANELIPRTSEQARILGIDFFSVFSRGSQFKVESLMFRIAKPENFILISPSRKQVGQQNALECLPLVMEPQSDFYTSPLLVLDFQSLYPSIMIAYNYCYSTYLGRIVNWRGRDKMGVIDYERQEGLLSLLRDQINIAPNGIMYTKPETRKSLLARMLAEILETRVMVKNGMKADQDDKTLHRLLNNRQLALKLIANVTYGYTSASFSGRMPCSEIADSIVQTARETLEKAIAMIHSVERWGAEVVYGDTDSLFIYLKGRTRQEAFDIGGDIARTITDSNPRPMKLKFEKVYHPCVLLAKKRYVGYMYESRDQEKPQFDAKGIETVRRDGTPAEQKIEEKALKILFETADLSRVKQYFQKQCTKIMRGKVSVQDFCFAREVKLGTYSDKGAPPPGALISAKRMLEDPRSEPQYGERVPYVVASGAPGARLIDRCVAPEVLLQDAHMELDSEYYISKNLIPPLERIFNLVGANVRQWYDEVPKHQRVRRVEGAVLRPGKDATSLKKTLESYMKSSWCVVCREKLDNEQPICPRCLREPHRSLPHLKFQIAKAERKVVDIHKVCRSCMGVAWGEEVKCDSKDCPVFYSRTRQDSDLRSTRAIFDPVAKILEEEIDREDQEVGFGLSNAELF